MSEKINTSNNSTSPDYIKIEGPFDFPIEIDTSSPAEEIYPPTKREYYFSDKTPEKIVYSISNNLLDQINTFELNRKSL